MTYEWILQKGVYIAAFFSVYAEEKLVLSVPRGTHLLIHNSDSNWNQFPSDQVSRGKTCNIFFYLIHALFFHVLSQQYF